MGGGPLLCPIPFQVLIEVQGNDPEALGLVFYHLDPDAYCQIATNLVDRDKIIINMVEMICFSQGGLHSPSASCSLL